MGPHLKKHPSLDYRKTYGSRKEAEQCWQVQEAANHHKVSAYSLVKLLTSGLSLMGALVQLLSNFVT